MQLSLPSLLLQLAAPLLSIAHERLCATSTDAPTYQSLTSQVLPMLQACSSFASSSHQKLANIVSSKGYLRLNESHPHVGQAFLQAAMQQVAGHGRLLTPPPATKPAAAAAAATQMQQHRYR